MQFEVINNGKKTMCDILATYEDNNKNYMVYTDRTYDKDKKLNLYYSLYEETNGGIKLIDVTDKEDKNICLNMVKDLIDKIKGNL